MAFDHELTFSLSGATRLYGILGYPIAHSLSPLMQSVAFQHHGLDCLYVPFPVSPSQLPQAFAGAIALGLCGLNVTIPHKEAILPLLDELSAESRFVGAVNTVAFRDGRAIGYNTDVAGFLQPLKALGLSFAHSPTCVLGAGGAARAVAMALLQAGCAALTLTNRTPARAEQLVLALQERFPHAEIRSVPFAQAASAAHDSALIVNATSVGLDQHGGELLPETCLQAKHVVYDIVYRPFYTPLLQAAQRRGATVVPGIDMLIGQGDEAFRIWTGRSFPLADIRRRLLAFLQP